MLGLKCLAFMDSWQGSGSVGSVLQTKEPGLGFPGLLQQSTTNWMA